MGLNAFSDYGSGGSMDSSRSWGSQELNSWSSLPSRAVERPKQKTSSFLDLVMGRCSLEDAMQEFRRNGSDSPYNPDEDLRLPKTDHLAGMGPSNVYLRQKSWPAPERTPAQRLPATPWLSCTSADEYKRPQVVDKVSDFVPMSTSTPIQSDVLTEEQRRVLNTLPESTVYSLLRQMEQASLGPRKKRPYDQECRFCKNNGERESYYRSHVLKDASGRVACPVLRAFVCARCGARGDHAHTIKYCPLSTAQERMKSTAMMRSVRMASGRRRSVSSASAELVAFGEAPQTIFHDSAIYSMYGEPPLDPAWAALEQKLL